MGLRPLVAALLLVILPSCLPRHAPTELAFDWSRIEVNGEQLQVDAGPGRGFTVELCGNSVLIHPTWSVVGCVVSMKTAFKSGGSIRLVEAAINVEGFPPAPEVHAYQRIRAPLGSWKSLPQPLGPELLLRAFPQGASYQEGTPYHFRLVFSCGGRLAEVEVDARLSRVPPIVDD